ncbi:peptidylprolyl isomerase [Tahibacter amnicola]|uniref:peptidylprolyl isomerase n=1 Tax=Tahibacter amnicola TaxID=2976241 RepID=A0ABY6BEV0_9GAMM|nr:peptidylprolyl isomerase [Tahibacter amnicola]UXI66880.1 peptidylprolyl isomerase [Tahibacter amnicola]
MNRVDGKTWRVIRVTQPGLALCLAVAASLAGAEPAPPEKPRTMTDVLAASKPSDWRPLDPANTLYLDIAAGRVVIELAPRYAPQHVANIKALVAEKYFDGIPFIRSHDNYVVQWGDPNGGDKEKAKPIRTAKRHLPAEFSRPIDKALPFTPLPDGDVYAPEVGWSDTFPVARDPEAGQTWLAHCYGTIGAGRDNAPDSGGGTELYVTIGHAPRHLDLNVTLVGRVVQGMELLSALPRGTAALGFYDKPEQYVPIKSLRLAADVPEAERTKLEILRTDTETFTALVETRRNRRDEWYLKPAGKVELCNVPLPVRAIGKAAQK